jgi:hypothetical protein
MDSGGTMSEPLPTLFDGVTINDERDNGRLTKQLDAVRTAMLKWPEWWTLAELSGTTGYPEASVSARLRDLRKAKFGGYDVQRKYVSKGLWAYRVTR